MRVALVAFTNPFTQKMEGGKRDILNRLKVFKSLGYQVDLYSFNNDDEKTTKDYADYVDNFYCYSAKFHWQFLFSKYPICVNKRFSNQIEKDAQDIIYDFVLYEGEQVFYVRKFHSINGKKHFIRMHDIESLYRKELAKSVSWKQGIHKLLQYRESKKFKRIEREFLELFDAFLFVSCDEQKEMMETCPTYKDKMLYLPFSIEYTERVALKTKKNVMLYFGDLALTNNYESLKWFCKNIVLPLEKKIDFELRICGKISDDRKEELSKISKNITVLGYADDLNEEIAKSSFIISPTLYGAGVKIKLIDALAKGQIVLTNMKTLEGTTFKHLEHLIVADTISENIDFCMELFENREKYTYLIDQAIEKINQEYSLSFQEEMFRNLTKKE